MPQTIEAIDHARAAAVPMVIAINKIDLPTADPDKIKRELAERDVLVEEWGQGPLRRHFCKKRRWYRSTS